MNQMNSLQHRHVCPVCAHRNRPDVFAKITAWADARNLIAGSDPFRQLTKLIEETGELAAGVAKHQPDTVRDSIGDCVVVLTILAAQHGLTLPDCTRAAYAEIKDRKGRMIDGVFVKEADLPPEYRDSPALAGMAAYLTTAKGGAA